MSAMPGQSQEGILRVPLSAPSLGPLVYPDSDGEPVAENTRQYNYITAIKGGLQHQYAGDPLVFIAADLFWYPVEGHPEIRTAPDTLVVLGRPAGHRRSYQQWLEGNIAPQVVFEVLSTSNREDNLRLKLQFYDRHGVQECYIYDPDSGEAYGYWRVKGVWTRIDHLAGWTSPLLGIRFQLEGLDLEIFGRDNRRFSTLDEVYQERTAAEANAERARSEAKREQQSARRETQRAEKEKQRAEHEKQRAEKATQRAEQEKERAEQATRRTEEATQRADEERQRAEQLALENQRLLAKLKSLGGDLPSDGP